MHSLLQYKDRHLDLFFEEKTSTILILIKIKIL